MYPNHVIYVENSINFFRRQMLNDKNGLNIYETKMKLVCHCQNCINSCFCGIFFFFILKLKRNQKSRHICK